MNAIERRESGEEAVRTKKRKIIEKSKGEIFSDELDRPKLPK